MIKDNLTENSLLAKSILDIKPSPTLEVTNKAAQLKEKGIDIISLGAGEPDFDTPINIKKAAIQAINDGHTKYTAVGGIKKLKQAIGAKFLRENSLEYNEEEIITGCGAKHIIYNAFCASLNKDDEVIIPAPYWVSYPDMVKIASGKPIILETKEDSGFKATAEEILAKISNRTKWLILNSPSNPTGSLYDEYELKEIANLMNKFPNLNIMSDDIYEHLIYDNVKFKTIAEIAPEFKDRILTVNGVSKAYSMTGWRIGYAAGNKDLIKAMAKIQSQSTSNPSSISQHAAIEALNGKQDFIESNKILFQKRRDLAVKNFNAIKGLSATTPKGAFYIMVNCTEILGKKMSNGTMIENSKDLATYLLEVASVAVVPGIAFGAEGFFRVSYATSEEIMTKACKKIKKALE